MEFNTATGQRNLKDRNGDGIIDGPHFEEEDLYGDGEKGQVAGLQYMLMGWPVRAEIHTLNLGFTYIAEPSALWDNLIMVGELGGWYIGGYEDDQLLQSALGSFTKYGSGMSAQFMPEYKNVLEGVDLVVPFFVNYGIDGYEAYFSYSEKSLWWSVGVEATYLEHWRFSSYYNDFSGPDNIWADRDNVSVNVKYIF